jgi:putative transposase
VNGLRSKLAEFHGEAEHVRLLVNFPLTVTISRLVSSLHVVPQAAAGVPRLAPPLLVAKRLWLGSYFARSARSAPNSVLRQYIEQQDHPA